MGDDLAVAGPNFVPIPRRVSVNVPSSVSKVPSYIDEFGNQIYKSSTDPALEPGDAAQKAASAYIKERDLLMAATMADPVNNLHANDGECTYSHLDDYDNAGPQWRQCKSGLNMVPPPPGALLDPVGIAVDGDTVYVVDDFNSRIQAYDFEGRVKPMQFPIGNGIPGIGPYSYASQTPAYRPYANFPGFETFDGGYSGSMLNAPNGIAVDGARNIIVADSGNHRIAVFNRIGQEQFDFALPNHLGTTFKPTLVSVTPGAVVLPTGSAIPAGHESDRIVVTDWSHCFVRIYKVNFEEVRSLPAAFPANAMHDACLNPGDPDDPLNPPVNTGPGEFSTVTGAIVDDLGHIYITDHAQSVVQVFNLAGDTVGWIGKPGVQPAPGEINGPVGLAFDHLNRLGVIDGGNSRVVFYSLKFDPVTDAPTATFEFQLDVTVSVQDFPMGLAEQVGSGPGLDPKGRFLATDPFNRRVLRFELPELGIADAQAPFMDPVPLGTPAGTQVGHGTFKVLVPKQKLAAVKAVEVMVTPVESGVTVTPGSVKPLDPALAGPPQVLPDIAPGEYVSYEFYYTAPDTVRKATFQIDAKGDYNAATGLYKAVAPQSQAQSRALCGALCDAEHEVYWLDQASRPGLASFIHNNTTGDWYPDRVSVKITPKPIDADVVAIGWSYGGNAAVFYPQKGDPQESPLDADRHVDVPFGVDGANHLYYWAISSDGSVGTIHEVDMNIDLLPPTGTFVLWPPYTGTPDTQGAGWYNHPVTVSYNVSDAHSGTDADVNVSTAIPDGQRQLTTEGRNQFVTVDVADRVNRVTTLNSATSAGGRYVNIDMVPPQFDTEPTDIVVTVNGQDAQGSYAIIGDAFRITATDPPLSDNTPGSGVAGEVTNPVGQLFRAGVSNQWTYTAVDHAGNIRSKTVNVIVRQAASELGAPDQTVGYGGRVFLRANVTPRGATGTVTFNWGPYSVSAPVQTVSGGIDPATGQLRVQGEAVAMVDPVLANVGPYPMHVTYSGDELNGPAVYDLATVTVTPRTLTISADAKLKYYGDPDPAFTFSLAGLINNDTATVTLSRAAGTAVGDYPIQLQSVVVSPNYRPVFESAALRIIGRVTVAPRNQTITYGDADPAFGFDYSALPEGAIVSTPPTCVVPPVHSQAGAYPITCSGAAGNFLQFSYGNATLLVNQRRATIVAGSGTKLFGEPDPALGTTQTGILAADLPGITLKTTRAAGETVGDYVTTPSATGGASANYLFTLTPGLFKITPATASVVVTGGTFTYDGQPHPASCTVYGVGGTTLPSTLTYTPGPGVPVNAGSYTATCAFAGNANYPPMSDSAPIVINRRAATIVAGSGTKVVGAGDPVLGTSQTGILAADLGGITLTTTRAAGETVGNYATTAAATGGNSANYIFTMTPGNFSITATVLVTPRPKTITYGDALPAFDFDYGVFPAGYGVNSVVTSPVCTVSGAAGNAGSYTISCTGGSIDSLVRFVYATNTLTINKKPATLTAGSNTKVFGSTDPALVTTQTGILAGDLAGIVLSTTRDAGENVGSYVTRPSATGGASPNYTFTTTNGTLTITKATPIAKVVGGTFTYDQTSHGGTCTVTGVNGASLTGTLTYTPGGSVAPVNAGTYSVSCAFAGDSNYNAVSAGPATITINPRPISVAAQPKQKFVGAADPALTYVVTSGSLLSGDAFAGALVRDAGEAIGSYPIRQGTLTAGPNYALTFTNSTLTIVANNVPPDAVDDFVTVNGTTMISVLTNDRDPDGDPLTITAVTQPPARAGTVTIVGSQIQFTPVAGFAGTVTFTYSISDGKGGTDTATVTICTCNLSGFRTQTQGGWGSSPTGGNPGALLAANFAKVFPAGYVQIGSTKTLRFTSQAAVQAWLPRGGTSGVLTGSAVNPSGGYGTGNIGGQLLALQISVEFSRKGVTRGGLDRLVLKSGKLAGYTVGQVLDLANGVVGGSASLPTGLTITELASILESLNTNFDNGTINKGVVAAPNCP